jgi:hypothetical protein
MSRGKSQASLDIIAAAAHILEREKTNVRGVCYALFVGTDIPTAPRLIPSVAKIQTDKVSRLLVGARLDGIIPWESIFDDTRELEQPPAWRDPAHYFRSVAEQFAKRHWARQPRLIQLWSEKSTVKAWLAEILDRYQLPFMVTHGNQGWTWLYRIAQMSLDLPKPLLVLLVNDFDPSGLFMTERDLPERLAEIDHNIELRRIMLLREDCIGLPSWDYHEKKNLLNAWFERNYGPVAWELDAVAPAVLRARGEETLVAEIDWPAWEKSLRDERRYQRWSRQKSLAIAAEWERMQGRPRRPRSS